MDRQDRNLNRLNIAYGIVAIVVAALLVTSLIRITMDGSQLLDDVRELLEQRAADNDRRDEAGRRAMEEAFDRLARSEETVLDAVEQNRRLLERVTEALDASDG